jgi:hypothetical protein
MADNTVKILLLVVILLVLWYVYQQNKTPMFIGPSGEPVEKAAEEIVHRDCSGTEYIIQKPCSRNGVVLDGLSDETSGAGFETHVLDKNHEGFVRQLGDGVCPPKLVECNVDPPKPCSGNTWLDAMCVRLDVNGNELVLEDGNADACGDGILKQTLDTNAPDYEPATQGGLCTFERSGACQKTCPEAQPPACNYPVSGWQMNDLGCVKSRDDLTPVGCGETGEVQLYMAATMNTEYCKNLTKWQSCTMQACPQDCVGSWSDWEPNPDACDVQPSESRIYSITQEAVGNTQYGYGKPCEEIHDKVETRSRQEVIQPCCTQTGSWTGPIGGVCSPFGTGIFTQTTTGQCPEELKSQVKPCCYQKGDWEKDGGCKPNGKQTWIQTIAGNCTPGTETKEEDCCYKTEWSATSLSCPSTGQRPFIRSVTDACKAVPTENDKELCDSELARLKNISSKEGVKGVRYVWFGYKDIMRGTSRGKWSMDAYHGKAGQPLDDVLNIGGIEIYSGGENVVKNWDRETELLKGVTVNSSWEKDATKVITGDYGTARLFDGNSSTMYHSGSSSHGNGFPHQIDPGTDGWCIGDHVVHQDVPGCGRICSSWEYVGSKEKGSWGLWGDNQNDIDCPDARLDEVWKLTGGFGDDSGTRTNKEKSYKDNYIQIDLGKEYTIDEVKVFNRNDSTDPRDPWRQRWQGAVLELLDSNKNVLKTGDDITAADTVNTYKTYSFSVDPDTLAKLEGIMDVVPSDLSTIKESQWRKIIPACELTKTIDESRTYKEEPCQYVGEWDQLWGTCDGSNRYKTRVVKNANISVHAPEFDAAILNPATTMSQSCSPCKGEWRKQYGGESALRMNRTRHDRHKRQVWTQYFQTKAAFNGGQNDCPSVGTKKDQYEQRRKNGDFDYTQHVVETVVGG